MNKICFNSMKPTKTIVATVITISTEVINTCTTSVILDDYDNFYLNKILFVILFIFF